MIKNIKTLDVTLRDGGCVIDFNFGKYSMNKILHSLEEAKIDIIELGYIDQINGSKSGRTQYLNERCIYQNFLKTKKSNITYVAMIDHGKFNVTKLEKANKYGIDGIRYCFHKKDYKSAIEKCSIIANKGYKVFIQPMITMRYSFEELGQLILLVNEKIPNASGFYIVDSFGEMRFKDVKKLILYCNKKLNKNISLGFHSHNNLQLSYSNAMSLLDLSITRPLILDGAIMGMGKGAGNLNTELLIEHLNLFNNKKYYIKPLLEVIDKVIQPLHSEFYWGYSVEYYLSSINKCTPSYASYFYDKHMLPINEVGTLLSMIEPNKKISFDKKYAEELYLKFNSNKKIDDSKVCQNLLSKFNNASVLIIAPGKSINNYNEDIKNLAKNKNIISISLNLAGEYDVDYSLITRVSLLEECNKKKNIKFIVSSNIYNSDKNNVFVIDYKKWITIDKLGVHDSSSVICFNLLKKFKVKEIILAGFDGFSSNPSENYYNQNFKNSIDNRIAKYRNEFYSKLIIELKKDFKVKFLTPSKYEN